MCPVELQGRQAQGAAQIPESTTKKDKRGWEFENQHLAGEPLFNSGAIRFAGTHQPSDHKIILNEAPAHNRHYRKKAHTVENSRGLSTVKE
jgi:hypothetical protein